ncbi:MAG TPA: cytochrome c [Chryseosolibacter sp.]
MALVCLVIGVLGCETKPSAPQRGDASWPESFGFGRVATPDEIALLDTDVSPSGRGLPPGSGSFSEGKSLYAEKCSRCHGPNGFEGPYNKLVHHSSGKDEKTIGNYWPHATTVFDYINRTMPYDAPGSLTPDEVYSITLFLLAKNNLVDSTIILDASNLAKVHMPAKNKYVADDREETSAVR